MYKPFTSLFSSALFGILSTPLHSSAQLGFDAVLQADGQAKFANVRGSRGSDGRDGYDGRDGRDGQNAYCPDPRGPARNGEDGEDGWNGKNGHRGADGQDGGDTLIYFEDSSLLKLVTVDARGGEGGIGGRGGRGGLGGRGGWGCNGGWRGRDGRDGYYGSAGGNGSRGRLGQVYIKQGMDPLQASITRVSKTIREFFASTTLLRKNFWEEKSGIRGLLNPSSTVADIYQQYVSTNEITAAGLLTWDQQPSETVLSQVISIQFNEPYTEPTVVFGDERIIVFFSREQQENHFIYKIDSIYNSDDFFHFKAGIRGEIGRDRRILVSDLKNNWSALPTELSVSLVRSGSTKTHAVPTAAIRKSPYGPEIMIAKVPGLKGNEGGSFDKVLVNMHRNLKGRIIKRSFEVKGGGL